MPIIDPHIFRAYDIRGKAHSQLSTEAAYLIARGFGTTLRRMYTMEHPIVAVGKDARTHGPVLERAVIEGLLSTGCIVRPIGQTPSPLNYFTICEQKIDAGIQVTASHNPKEDNGLKLQIREAEAYSGEDLQTLRKLIEKGDFLDGDGTLEDCDAIVPYIRKVSSVMAGAGKDLTVVVDAGNGVTGPVNCAALRAVGAKVIELYTEPDGEFPNHPADPSKHDTLRDLQAKVKEEHADIGLAFDGDGDRLGIVDETGAIRSADEILLLLAKDHLSRHPHKPVVFTVSNSGILETEIKKWGGTPVMCKVGHSYVEHAMREHRSLLGGEQSGHFFCGENYYPYDDALMAAMHVLKIQSGSGKPFSHLMADFPKVYQAHELRPHCPDNKKAEVIRRVTEHFQQSYPVNTLDGVRIDFGEGAWAGIRQSNTSPCISVCMEARSSDKLKEIETLVLQHLRGYSELTMDK